jgi:hypothetical protein
MELFQKAAEQDLPSAQYSLGEVYESGRGVKADRKQALKWYRKSAKQGFYMAEDKVKVLESQR